MTMLDASLVRPFRRTLLRGASALAGALLLTGGTPRAAGQEPPERPSGLVLSALELTGLGEAELAALGVRRHAVAALECPSGRLLAGEAASELSNALLFARRVPPGRYTAFAYEEPDTHGFEDRACLAELRISDAPVLRWELATFDAPDVSGASAAPVASLKAAGSPVGLCDAAVRSAFGFAGFVGILASASPVSKQLSKATADIEVVRELRFSFAPDVNLALFNPPSLYREAFASYWGLDAEGRPARLVIDLGASDGSGANRRLHAGAEPGVPTGATLSALRRTDLSDADLAARRIERRSVSQLACPTGRIVACDPLVGLGDHPPLARSVPTGRHPVRVYIDLDNDWGERVGLAELRLSETPVARWQIALTDESIIPEMVGDMISGYGVDAGTGCFCDEAAQKALADHEDARMNAGETSYGETTLLDAALAMEPAADHRFAFADDLNVALFHSGFGDGYYASYWGFDASGEPARLVTSFGVFEEADARPRIADKEPKQ
ncbi:DUF4241 domain-containing protein [Antarcticirhabdus aurantiaca]|uniref:DUF4241 domain-containing protein n=1 Tax=Antarcticirhabdus aurantiaca TaxID=2606717 RepID=A0ACD4NPF8_9HYPH|nr:DUF4241 domain-containing protein [Antarcticirhabdus aurantiaca]WAJ28679.1 DUF4241 domain-containing protein [Jeongeuplla avenae]